MKRSLIIAVMILNSSLIFLTCRDQSMTADKIVVECTKAMLGTEKNETLKTLRLKINYPDHGIHHITHEIRRPNFSRNEANYILVFDSEHAAFIKHPPKKDGQRQPPELIDAAELVDFEVEIDWFVPAFFDHPFEYLGIQKIEEVDFHKLLVKLPLGAKMIYYISAKNYLIGKVTADFILLDRAFHTEREFSDYREINGVLYPHTFTYEGFEGGRQTATIDVVEINPTLNETRFRIPDELLQRQ